MSPEIPDHEFLKYTRRSMILVGAWKMKVANKYLSAFYKIWTVLSQSYYILFCISFTIGMHYVLKDPIKLAETNQYLLLSLLLLWKLILSQSQTIRSRIDEIVCWETQLKKQAEVDRSYTQNVKYNHRIFFSLTSMYFLTCCQFISNGYMNWARMRSDFPSEKILIFTGWFPFDSKKYFDVAYWFQVSNGVFVCMYSISFDSLIISLIIVATARLRILGYKFERFGEGERVNFSLLLKSLILEHQEIIRYVENLNESLKWYFFCDFVVKSYHISLVLVSLMNQNKSALVFSFLILLYLLTQVFCFYYHANELILESTNLGNSIFHSK
ncbi:uncharacterized protein [Leptinotarsa decemlineata]|uniref:uncharacterized protein n=1 Tax=Leptinotarsa decemlineata TaxID=7539 RepID=UPI003D306BBF